jgi:hypothetical protein
MSTSNKDFSPAESLQLIRSMIETTKTSLSDNSHFFLLWGWATLVGCLLQYYLLVIANYSHHYYAWLVTPIALLLHFIFIYKHKKQQRAKTFIGETMGFIWFIIGFSYLALAIVFIKIGWQYCFPFYIMLYSIGTYISGSILSFKPMRIGGGICLVLVAIAPFLDYSLQILLAAFAILISYLIPGYLLRSQYRKQKL